MGAAGGGLAVAALLAAVSGSLAGAEGGLSGRGQRTPTRGSACSLAHSFGGKLIDRQRVSGQEIVDCISAHRALVPRDVASREWSSEIVLRVFSGASSERPTRREERVTCCV
jgi:hypothetical protein